MNIYVPMCTSMYTSNLYRRCFCLIEEAARRGVCGVGRWAAQATAARLLLRRQWRQWRAAAAIGNNLFVCEHGKGQH